MMLCIILYTGEYKGKSTASHCVSDGSRVDTRDFIWIATAVKAAYFGIYKYAKATEPDIYV